MTTGDPTEKARRFIEARRGAYEKSWVPYEGPQGGIGWQNTDSGDIVYDDEPPGDMSLDFTGSVDPDDWDVIVDELEGVDGSVIDESLSGVAIGDEIEYERYDGSMRPTSVVGFGYSSNGDPRVVVDERDHAGALDHSIIAPDKIEGADPGGESDETGDGGSQAFTDTSVEDIDGWETMDDDDIRAVIEEVHDGENQPSRREVYDIIGTPPAHGNVYEDEDIDAMDMSSTTSDVATEYDTLSEFEEARQSGELDRSIEEAHRAFTGRSIDIDGLSDEAADALRDEVKQHVVFDLIWHHRTGRSDELFNQQ